MVRRGGGEAGEGVGVTDGLAEDELVEEELDGDERAEDGLAEEMVAGEGCGEVGWTAGMVDWSGGAAGGGTGDWGVPARDCIGCCGHGKKKCHHARNHKMEGNVK